MQRRTKVVGGAVIIAAAVATAIGGAVVASSGGDDDERPITGDALERASAAAIAHLGEGRVTETEQGDEDSYYEVELTLDDGSQVDVQLDRDFDVVGDSPDVENPDDDGD
jgi:hypothetical protein